MPSTASRACDTPAGACASTPAPARRRSEWPLTPPAAPPARRPPQARPHSGAAGASAGPASPPASAGEPRPEGSREGPAVTAEPRTGQLSPSASGRRGRLSGGAARRRSGVAPPPARSGPAPGGRERRWPRAPPGGAFRNLCGETRPELRRLQGHRIVYVGTELIDSKPRCWPSTAKPTSKTTFPSVAYF